MYSCIAVEGCRGLYSCRASVGGSSKGEGVVEDCRGELFTVSETSGATAVQREMSAWRVLSVIVWLPKHQLALGNTS